jgi:manganese/zinc/iron transport system permease protein
VDFFNLLKDLFADYTLRTVAAGAAVLGIVSGALGSFAFLRRQSLLGDAISHAALPGIALAFLLTGSKKTLVLVAGAGTAGWIGTFLVSGIVRTSRIKYDAALGLVLSVFFGFGLVLLTFIQRRPEAAQAGLDKFLFGQASTLLAQEVWTMAVIGGAALFLLFLFWKEFKLLAFDPDFAQTLGFPARSLDLLLTSLLVAAIVIGLQTVGVVLMSALVVAPAAAARQWTDRLGVMVLLSAFFGALAGLCGAVASSAAAQLPTGPMIVVCVSTVVLFSLFLAPKRGLWWAWVQARRNRKRLLAEAVLSDLFELARQHKDFSHPHSAAVLAAMRGQPAGILEKLSELEKRGWARRIDKESWALTVSGAAEAEKLFAKGGE